MRVRILISRVGKATRGYDPSQDIVWLRSEIVRWIQGNLMTKWYLYSSTTYNVLVPHPHTLTYHQGFHKTAPHSRKSHRCRNSTKPILRLWFHHSSSPANARQNGPQRTPSRLERRNRGEGNPAQPTPATNYIIQLTLSTKGSRNLH